MSFIELILIAIGLSMDAFAVAATLGITMKKATFTKALTVSMYFGVSQGLMPILGYILAFSFSEKIVMFDHWVAFVLLSVIGGKMIFESLKKSEKDVDDILQNKKDSKKSEADLSAKRLFPLAVATSIDALAIGVSFAFINVSIVPAASVIAITTGLISFCGVKIGSLFGTKLKSKAEFVGGAILVIMGLKIILEHLGYLAI